MLEAILVDLYGARTLLTDRILEPADVWASYRYRLAAIGQLASPRWLTTYSVDVVKDTSGHWHVVQDLTDQPPGWRLHVHGSQRARPGAPRRRGARSPEVLVCARSIRSPTNSATRWPTSPKTESPRIVVMSGGVEHPSFVGQAYLASRLGLNLAEGADLVVRQRRLWLRSLAGLEPIDVLYRRLEGDRIDPMEVNARRRRRRARPARRGSGGRRQARERARHRRDRRSRARRVVGRRRRLDRRSASAVR